MRLLQAALRAVFMRVDAVFNRAFGDRMNPLYHLGTISFFLFWVVTASGLYLYAFFETGVAEAYDSMQRLTHGQWWAGGVMRSLHRYASDAMVLTMALHLLRHFAFDRHRGFRWFSWVSGVVLVWGVYVSGINGYMLPWDRLAQYVITTSFEWLEWLPGFGGRLMRNFVYPESVNDRFFSLLSFMHIGLPLGVLLLLFVHVQRVPKARTNPPQPIALALLATLLVLSLVHPALSQGGAADLTRVVSAVRLDWFYLPLFPLFDAWPAGAVWALVGGLTLLLALLPWLPPRRRARGAGVRHMTVHPSTQPIALRPGETLLEAGLRHGLALPYECRAGGCGLCRCTVLHGQVDLGAYQPGVLTAAQRARGEALLCCATALSDVEVDVEGAPPPQRTLHTATVERLERLAPEVMRVVLALPAGQRVPFRAGQYIDIVLDDGSKRAFSFANPPGGDEGRIELHVRRIPGGRFTGHVFDAMKVGDTLRFEGPLGDFTLREGEQPILFVAGATGFAPVKSIVEDAFARGVRRPMQLYWGVRRASDLYALDLAERWQREHAGFRVTPVLSEADEAWQGRRGLVHEAMLADHADLRGYEVYVCGSVKMVQAAVPDFLAHGLGEDACFTDAFVPRAPASPAGAGTAG